MLPDYDNTIKWLNWLKTKRLYKIWMISPLVLLFIVGFLWKQNAELKNELDKTRNEIIPIKQLYPKLELSAAVAKLIENHNQLKTEIDIAKQKEVQRHFVPLSQNRAVQFKEEAQSLVSRYPHINFEFQVLCVNPSNHLFNKATELTDLFRTANIKAKYANTMFSSKYNVVIKYSEVLPQDMIDEIEQLLKIVFKNTLYFKSDKSSGKDSDGNILIYFLGTPSFDNEGCVFYEDSIF